jgi:hypothetical protein
MNVTGSELMQKQKAYSHSNALSGSPSAGITSCEIHRRQVILPGIFRESSERRVSLCLIPGGSTNVSDAGDHRFWIIIDLLKRCDRLVPLALEHVAVSHHEICAVK